MAFLTFADSGYYGAHHSLIPPWTAGALIVVLLLVAFALARGMSD